MVLDIDPATLGMQMGGSAIIGATIGFAAKKVAKIIAFIIGLELILFKFLETRGVIQVRWRRLVNQTEQAAQAGQEAGSSLITAFVETAGIGAGFVGGFALGFKKA